MTLSLESLQGNNTVIKGYLIFHFWILIQVKLLKGLMQPLSGHLDLTLVHLYLIAQVFI